MGTAHPIPAWPHPLCGLVAVVLALAGCSVQDIHHSRAPLPRDGAWVILPWENRAEAPRAGERLEPVLKTLLLGRGVVDLTSCPPLGALEGLPDLDTAEEGRRAREWAIAQGFEYAVQGSVTEWRYKAGLDGEPAVGLTVTIVDLGSSRVVWSASGARAGWGRESLSGAAQKLLRKLIASLDLEES